ncbi:TPA: hypothetical protein N0F65_008793 [Lagenidium giganteum]|uniref:Guanine deaminase n=1 Tax=Lagenidium giganteum TaxID=4803 RepID=A0AAV2YZV4_9STRA|nr:TPA: hypothetical protein N0F65_008793 [Lagenidium giganteum]
MSTERVLHVRGKVVHAPIRGQIEILPDAFMAIDAVTGRITTFHAQTLPADVGVLAHSPRSLQLTSSQFIIPGFVDTHVHAPQYQYTGTGTDTPLMQWLTKYTFPVEEAFADVAVAQHWYSKLLDRMLAEGITTAQYFATIHVDATKTLVDLVAARGQRGLVGLVAMDQNAPDSYRSPSAAASLADAEAFIQYTRSLQNELVLPVLTPRFVPTCSLELLRGLGELAAKYDVHVQSHIAESHDEEAFVEQLHPGRRDTEIFAHAKLLTNKACMAHAVHLQDAEMDVLAAAGTSIAHCPLSNFFFANGFLDVEKAVRKRVNVGLGTDMAGGYSPSMLRAIQTCVLTFKAREIVHQQAVPLDYKDAFWLATMGGATALELQHDTGSFAVGKCLDAIVVDMAASGHPGDLPTVDFADRDTDLDQFQKFIHNGDSRNFQKVLVKGRIVHERTVDPPTAGSM